MLPSLKNHIYLGCSLYRIIAIIHFLFSFCINSAQINLDEGLVTFYQLNGNANDESSHANHGIIIGAIPVMDRFGNNEGACFFDGINDQIDISDQNYLDLYDDFTISIWYYQDHYDNNKECLLAKGGETPCNYELRMPGKGDVFGFGRHNIWTRWSGNSEGDTDQWNHFVITYTSGDLESIKAYLNNHEYPLTLKESDAGANPGVNDLRLTVAYFNRPYYGDSSYYFKGKLDDIRIYNRVLTRDEIDSLYHENGWDPLSFGLIGDYPLSGNAGDESRYVHNGTIIGAVPVEDRYGDDTAAYYFNGSSDYISTPLRFSDHLDIGDPVQISGWFKTGQKPSSNRFILGGDPGNEPEFDILLKNSGKISVRLYGCEDVPISDKAVNDNRWHHVSFGWNSDTSNFYVDGIRQSGSLGDLGSFSNNDLLWFGARNNSGVSDFFEGVIDDFKIYDRPLSKTEILQLYANYQPPESFNVINGDRRAVLSWDTTWHHMLDKIYIYRDHSLDDSLGINSISDTTYTDSGLVNGKSYSYFIKSSDLSGNLSISSVIIPVTPLEISTGLSAFYPFNGNSTDESGNVWDGTVYNAEITKDHLGTDSAAFGFNGTDSYIDLGDLSLSGLDKFTVSTWIKIYQSGGMIIADDSTGSYRSFYISVDEDGYMETVLFTDSDTFALESTDPVDDTLWHDISFIKRNEDIELWIDGRVENALTVTGLILNGVGINAGRRSNTSDPRYFKGIIDEIRFYERALDAAEIRQKYANHNPPGSFRVRPGNRLVTLNWDSTGLSLLEKVYIYRDQSLLDSVDITSGTDTSYSDQDLDNGMSHSYYIRSSDASGNISISSDNISVTPTRLPEGLIAWYPFNNSSGDESGNKHDAENEGALHSADRFGMQKASYHFDGSADHMTINSGLPLSDGSFSISFWEKHESNEGILFSQGVSTNEFYIRYSGGSLQFGFDVDELSTETSYTDTLPWRHWICTFDTSTSERIIYLNGDTLASDTAGSVYSGTGNLSVGSGYDHNNLFAGNIDEIRIYNRPLTTREVRTLYANFHPPGSFTANAGDASVTLNWSSSGYQKLDTILIYRNNSILDSLPFADQYDTVFTDNDLINNQGYTYYIRSIDSMGYRSISSDTLSLTPSSTYSGMTAWYPLNGNANDMSGNGNNGTSSGGMVPAPDRFGAADEAFTFDGTDDYICTDTFILGVQAFTISLWVKLTGSDSVMTIVNKNDSYSGNLDGDIMVQIFTKTGSDKSQILFGRYEGGIWLDTTITSEGISFDGKWNHVVCAWNDTLDEGSARVFINGTEAEYYNKAKWTGGLTPNNNPIWIGTKHYESVPDSFEFSGILDDIRFYDRSVTGTEIHLLYGNYYPPGGLKASAGDRQTVLHWKPDRWDVLDRICIYRNNVAVDNLTIDGMSDTLYTDAGLINGQIYRYFIRSIDTLGNISIPTDTLSVVPTAIPEGLAAWYPFNGDASDQSGNGNHGIEMGPSPGFDRMNKPDAAYFFNGTGDYIELSPYVLDTSSDFSVTVWFKSFAIGGMIIADTTDTGSSFYIFHRTDGKIEGSLTTTDSDRFTVQSDSIPAQDSSWHQLVFSRNENYLKLYLDGRKKDSTDISGHTGLGSGIQVGRTGTSSGNLYFNGLIDDIRIYERTLTDRECLSLYGNFHSPDSLVVTAGFSKIDLAWSSEEIEGLDRYRIFRDSMLLDSLVISSPYDTVYSDTNLNSGVFYNYFITSVDTLGFESSHSDTARIAALGLVAGYPFREDTLDAGKNQYHARLSGVAMIEDFLSIGTNDSDAVILPDEVLDRQGDFTIIFNLRLDSIHLGADHFHTIIGGATESDDDAFRLVYVPDTDYWEVLINGTITSFADDLVEDRNWHQVTLQRIADSVKLFIDSNQVETTKPSDGKPLEVSPGGTIIGQEQDAVGSGFDAMQSLGGNLYDFRIFNYPLAGQEIDSLFSLLQWFSVEFQVNYTHTSGLPAADGTAGTDSINGIPPFSYSWSTGATTDSIGGLPEGEYTITVTDARDSSTTKSFRIYNRFTDGRDSSTYKVIWIGNQIWMAENLNYTAVSGSYYYGDDSTSNAPVYGRLYEWESANGACPAGWRLPTDDDWTVLEEYLGMDSTTAAALGWRTTNKEGDSLKSEPAVGFNVLYGGKRNIDGSFDGLETNCYYWTSSEYDESNGWYRELASGNPAIRRDGSPTGYAMSVRCIVDDPVVIPDTIINTSGFGKNDGSIRVNVSGGQPPFTYLWFDKSTSRDITGLAGGVYLVTINDVLGKESTDSFRVYDALMDERDGQEYAVIKIGNQVWMAENLNMGEFTFGVLDQTNDGKINKYAYDDDTSNLPIYGGLYQWDEMMDYGPSQNGNPGTTQGVCPAGWHIPTNEEVKELESYIGLPKEALDSLSLRGSDEGGKLKEIGLYHWLPPNTGATDEFGLNFLPNGIRNNAGNFEQLRETGGFWTSTINDPSKPYKREVYYDDPRISLVINEDKTVGNAVRCVLDQATYTLSGTNTTGIGVSDGSIKLDVEETYPPYSYHWSNGDTTQDIDNLYSGVYTIIFTDALGISIKDSIRIYDTFIDERDDREYRALRIGSQVWMAENLNHGLMIDSLSYQTDNGVIEKYCYSSESDMCDSLGGYYQWWEMMQYNPADNDTIGTTQGICPAGWHLPTDEEWKTLEKSLGMSQVDADAETWRGTDQGDLLKVDGKSGFEAMMAGNYNHVIGSFELLNEEGFFWTASEDSETNPWTRLMDVNESGIKRLRSNHKEAGRSVRCVLDLASIELTGNNTTGLGVLNGTAQVHIKNGLPPYRILWSNGDKEDVTDSLKSGVYSVQVTDSLGSTVTDSIRIYDSFVDNRDGYSYKAVKIEDQTWMAENLKATKYQDGEPMIDGTGLDDISGDLTTKYYFWYNDSVHYADTYGALYTWAAATNGSGSSDIHPNRVQGVCPVDWHIPGDSEWKELEMNLGMSQAEADGTGPRGTDEGGKLKETGTVYWAIPNTGATNESGFSALPGGYRSPDNVFGNLGNFAYFWSSTENYSDFAWLRIIKFDNSGISREDYIHNFSFSVRCIRDPLNIRFNPVHTSGIGSSDGSINLSVNSGIPPYIIQWSNGDTTEDIGSLTTGIYSVTVTDAENESVTDSVRIYDTFMDERDDTIYKVIVIGNQLWMAENLEYGMQISGSENQGDNGIAELYCYNDSTVYCDTFGGLYQWDEMMQYTTVEESQGVCPVEWHIPSDREWKELERSLGMDSVQAEQSGERGNFQGDLLIKDGSSGFTALFGGKRNEVLSFDNYNTNCYFWTSTEDPTGAWFRSMSNTSSKVIRDIMNKNSGLSVRCLRDSMSIEFEGVQNTSCLLGRDGSINLSISGGVPPYDYSWSKGSTTEDIDSLSAGMYRITVTDAVGEQVTDSVRIYDTFLDERDGTRYRLIIIGKQIWMAENLNYGTLVTSMITGVTHSDVSDNSMVEKYCYDNKTANCDTFGGLYDWNELMNYITMEGIQGICPAGWHIPTDKEWKQLEMYIGMDSTSADGLGPRGTTEGSMLKSSGTEYWTPQDTNASNLFGFSVLPAGNRIVYGSFNDLKNTSVLASSSQYDDENHWIRKFSYNLSGIYRASFSNKEGHSVRCIKDLAPLEIELDSIQHVSYLNGSDGAIYITITGGLEPYTYQWSHDTVTTQNIGNLPAGLHSITATDVLGTSITDTFRVYETFTDDRDNARYKTINIGDQTWMAENLNYYTTTGSWYYDNDSIAYSGIYGRLYDWRSTMQVDFSYDSTSYIVIEPHQGVCPLGWHIPLDSEWKALETYLGMDSIEAETTGWRGSDQGTRLKKNGSAGLELLPGGYKMNDHYMALDTGAYFWTATNNEMLAFDRMLHIDSSGIARNQSDKLSAKSVRCIRNYCVIDSIVPVVDSVSCFGLADGTISLNVYPEEFGYQYLWSTGDTIRDLNGLASGMYAATVTDSVYCSITDSIIVPQPDEVPVPIAPDVNIYSGQSNCISATGINIQWYDDPHVASTPISSTDIFCPDNNLPGIYNYYVTQKINGCESNADTVTLVINPIPELQLHDTSVCFGQKPVILRANGINVKWYVDASLDDPVQTGDSLIIDSILQPGSYRYFVTQSIDSLVFEPDTLTLTVNHSPKAYAREGVAFCKSDAAEYKLGYDTSETGYSYAWFSEPVSNIDPVPNPSVNIQVTTTYILTVTIDSTGCFDRDTMVITVFDNPSISVEPSTALIAVDSSIKLTASGVNRYSWFPANDDFEYVAPNIVSVSPDKNTTYIVSGYDNNNCQGRDSSIISVYCNRCYDHTLSSDTGVIYHGGICYYNPDESCEWRITHCNKGEISLRFEMVDLQYGDSLYIFTGSDTLIYYIYNTPPPTLYKQFEGGLRIAFRSDTVNEGRGFIAVYRLESCERYVGIENGYDVRLKILPNPFTNSTVIEFPNPGFESYKLVIMDLSGKVQREIDDIRESRYELKRGDLDTGFYIIEITGKYVYRGRIVIL